MTVDQCLAVNGVYKFEAKVCGVWIDMLIEDEIKFRISGGGIFVRNELDTWEIY